MKNQSNQSKQSIQINKDHLSHIEHHVNNSAAIMIAQAYTLQKKIINLTANTQDVLDFIASIRANSMRCSKSIKDVNRVLNGEDVQLDFFEYQKHGNKAS